MQTIYMYFPLYIRWISCEVKFNSCQRVVPTYRSNVKLYLPTKLTFCYHMCMIETMKGNSLMKINRPHIHNLLHFHSSGQSVYRNPSRLLSSDNAWQWLHCSMFSLKQFCLVWIRHTICLCVYERNLSLYMYLRCTILNTLLGNDNRCFDPWVVLFY